MDSALKRPSESAGQRAAVSHVAPADRDLAYDADAGQIRLPVTVHFTDGTTEETVLRLGPWPAGTVRRPDRAGHRDHPVDEVLANRLFGAAVSYLITAMEMWGRHLELCCGRLVDLAVHVFILDTKNYRDFCHQHFGGKFLEHIPEIAFKYDGSVERTAKVIADAGFEVDWKLWERDYAACGPCRPGEECH
ncbi:hypothetical protein [Streptomyces sp. NPDC059788]|uniref:hypothetical protein n=1 Tax=Streptomyces sp. NPDC059788 TaxID=3346948 RepID=UPI00365CC74D